MPAGSAARRSPPGPRRSCGCSGAGSSDLEQAQVTGGGPASAATCEGPREAEPNDAKANDLAGSACGTIDPATDVDTFAFTLPASAKGLAFGYEGNVSITVRADGKVVTISPGSRPALPLVRERPYLLEVRSADGKPQAYKVTVTPS